MRDDSGTIETRSVFRGRVLDLNVEQVRYPDGSEGRLEIVRHRGAAAALPRRPYSSSRAIVEVGRDDGSVTHTDLSSLNHCNVTVARDRRGGDR